MAIAVDALSPNQLAKRQQIVHTAQEILLDRGPAACTTRELARRSGLNKGLVYYYFASMDEIVDAAMASFADEAEAAIASTDSSQPKDDGALLSDYLSTFSHREGLALAWLEYWTLRIRAGHSEQLVWHGDQLRRLLTAALHETDPNEAEVRARVVASYIIGAITRSLAEPEIFETLGGEIAYLLRSTEPSD